MAPAILAKAVRAWVAMLRHRTRRQPIWKAECAQTQQRISNVGLNHRRRICRWCPTSACQGSSTAKPSCDCNVRWAHRARLEKNRTGKNRTANGWGHPVEWSPTATVTHQVRCSCRRRTSSPPTIEEFMDLGHIHDGRARPSMRIPGGRCRGNLVSRRTRKSTALTTAARRSSKPNAPPGDVFRSLPWKGRDILGDSATQGWVTLYLAWCPGEGLMERSGADPAASVGRPDAQLVGAGCRWRSRVEVMRPSDADLARAVV